LNSLKQLYTSIIKDEKIQRLKEYMQHGHYTTYQHSKNVLVHSIKVARVLHLNGRIRRDIIVGAMLHDYFLYDWHLTGRRLPEGIHAWCHPLIALRNVEKDFELSKKQKNIIRSHMFPTTLLHPPLNVAAWIVCLTDKWCSVQEYINGVRLDSSVAMLNKEV